MLCCQDRRTSSCLSRRVNPSEVANRSLSAAGRYIVTRSCLLGGHVSRAVCAFSAQGYAYCCARGDVRGLPQTEPLDTAVATWCSAQQLI